MSKKTSTASNIVTPEWVKDAIFYQIFPDRFARSKRSPELPGVQFKPWGTPAAEQGYQGGDLYGIIDQLDYLQALGINALYLNPIFSSASNHRYHTFDYFQVDPLLGGNDAFKELLAEAHQRDMKVILDGVFNHASRGFWAFHHILENGPDSPYVDWFHIKDWPLNPYPRHGEEELNYHGWWDLPALPKFNTDNPGVRAYLFEVAEYWIRQGIDGWRLDVPHEIEDDSFWREFRQRVKAINPEAYIVGEIWDKADHWLQGDQYDAVMNYPLGTAALSFFGAQSLRLDYKQNHLDYIPETAESMALRANEVLAWYDWSVTQAQLNMLDSHDMPRALWLVQGDKTALMQALAFVLTMPGAPCIYYGTEVGMTGGNDPDCREAFPWHQPEVMDAAMKVQLTGLCQARHQWAILRRGSVSLSALNDDVLVATRQLGEQRAWVVYNRTDQPLNRTLLSGVVPESAAEQRLLGEQAVLLYVA